MMLAVVRVVRYPRRLFVLQRWRGEFRGHCRGWGRHAKGPGTPRGQAHQEARHTKGQAHQGARHTKGPGTLRGQAY